VIEFNTSEVSTFVKRFQRQILLLSLALGSSSVLLLSGCSSAVTSGLPGPSGEKVVASVHGKTHGGQFPVSGSTVNLYEVGATSGTAGGYGAASTLIATADNPTDSGGSWNISSFTCANASDELYVASIGGNPGLAAGTDNTALVLTAALGPCSAVEAGTPSFIFIDEVTTVAMEYALAGFSKDYLHIGTSATNTVGLTNAFATFNNLVNVTNGQALTRTPAYTTPPVSCATTPAACTPADTFSSIVPNDLINTLANVLAGCVNSDGTTNCSNLFAITGGSLAVPSAAITNTADAALYIAHNPGLVGQGGISINNLSNLLALSSISAPFSPALSSVPNDYTLTVNYVGGGLGGVTLTSDSGPFFSAIDQEGNIWVVDSENAGVAELNNLGEPLTPSTTINTSTKAFVTKGGYRPTGFTNNSAGGVSIDLNGNVWIADYNNCLIGLNGYTSGTPGAALTGSPFSTLCPNGGASQTAVDPNNNVWVMGKEAGSGFLLSTNSAGSPRFTVTSGFNSLLNLAGADYTGHMWYLDGGNGTIGSVNISNGTPYEVSGTLTSDDTYYSAMGALSASKGSYGTLSIWSPQPAPSGNISPFTIGSGTNALDVLLANFIPPTEISPTGIAADGGSNYYWANDGPGTGPTGFSLTSNVTAYTSNEGLISPYWTGYTGGSALMALDKPNSLHIDQSGNVWVVNQNNANHLNSSLSGYSYLGNGSGAGNLTEFVGLALPVNPVLAQDALSGTNATNSGATATSVLTTTGSYGNLP
jgi:hypothetical protein